VSWLRSQLPIVIVLTLLAVFAAHSAIFALQSWTLEDMQVYLEAAQRLRDGGTLYATTNPLAAYQYAPWFAAAWVPLTYVPRDIVAVLWSAVLIAASIYAVMPMLRRPTATAIALVLLMLPILIFSSARSGNVQPLLVAALVATLGRRSGAVTIGIAASLKAFPIAFCLVYLARRQWWRLATSVLIATVLTAPMLLFDMSLYTVDAVRPGTLFAISPALWLLAVAAAAGATMVIATRRPRLAWLAAAGTVVLAMPRMLTYDTSFLLAATARPEDASGLRDQGVTSI
jgi:hypothetical protein